MAFAAKHQVAHDEQRPAIAEDFKGEIDRAEGAVFLSRHGLAVSRNWS